MTLLLPFLVLVVLYMFMIRPQQRRMRERQSMIRSAAVGDVVAMAGGIIGVIVADEGESGVLSLEVDTDVEVRVQRSAISQILTPAAGELP
ncbi:MAG TPA: preprotein translocase subunit YajC [Acidimicrobiaceae bacterium]|nr:preprotein translocase subunit YajC [Acidimicrobiaceae bacterium]